MNISKNQEKAKTEREKLAKKKFSILSKCYKFHKYQKSTL